MHAGADSVTEVDRGGAPALSRALLALLGRMEPVCSLRACLFTVGSLAGCAASLPSAKFELLADSTGTVVTDARDTFARIERLQRKFVVAVLPADGELTV